jgi:hypothetical protein
MIKVIVAWFLGPSGLKILAWYSDHNLLINGTVVALGILAIVFPRQRDRVSAFVRNLWQKTPLAVPEEERQAYERAKEKRNRRRMEKNR